MGRSIAVRLYIGTIAVVALLSVAWLMSVRGANALRATYVHTVTTDDALTQVVLEWTKLRDDQETALRGYLLTDKREFLAPYLDAAREIPTLRRRANQLVAGEPDVAALLLARHRVATAWERWAQGVLRDPMAYPRGSAALVAQQRVGKALFDRYRSDTARIVDLLDRKRGDDLRRSLDMLAQVDRLCSAIFAAAIMFGLLLGWRASRAVVRPLAALERAAQAIGRGDLARPVAVQGEREFVRLADSMDGMRRQLAAREAALIAAEERLRAIYAAMACGVIVANGRGEIVEANAAAQQLLGISGAMLSGRTLADVTGPSVREDGSALPVAERPMGRAMATAQAARDVVFGLTRLDGVRRWIQADAVPLLDAEGAVQQVVTSFVDVTERKQAEDAFRAEAARLNAVVAMQHDVTAAALDAEATMSLVVERARHLTGAAGAVIEFAEGDTLVYRAVSETMAGRRGVRLPLAGTLSGLCVRTSEVLRCDDSQSDPRTDPALCRELGIGSMIVVPLRQAGVTDGVLKVLAPAAHAFDDRDVQTLQLMAGYLAVTLAQARAFAALQESEERYRQVEQHAPIGLALVAPDGRWLRVNPALCEIVGYTEEELLSRTFQDITHPDDLDADVAYVRQALEGEIRTYQMEKRYIHRDGHEVWILLNVSLVRDPAGRPQYFIAQIQGIGERKEAEEALRASARELERSNAELQQFAYVASHDLQEPLRTVSSYLGLLRRRYRGKLLDAGADEFIDYAVDGAQRMQGLIQDVLAYSRVGTRGKEFAATDCGAIVDTVVSGLQAVIAEQNARLRYDGLPMVWGDDTQLRQLFQNLIGNALKFCRDVPPEVSITAERGGGEWLFAVRDNGIGIDPAYAEHVFEIFKRLHTREEYAGTGIGLAICKKIVERHGGRIWVESRPGDGATFRFTLPAAGDREERAA